MAILPFLAMTAAEMRKFSDFPPKVAWMACHFSPYGTGLSNLPKALPPGSLLMVDDITPPNGHDPVLITEQLTACAEELRCRCVLLDFQRREFEESCTLAKQLAQALPCPIAVSECCAGDLDCPVFLPPVPPSAPLETYLAPWKDREIWLELGLDGEILTLTEYGCTAASLPCPDTEKEGHSDARLHCHYSIEITEKSAGFTLWRTNEDLADLLSEAETLGVTGTVGLHQEISTFFPPAAEEP